MMWSLKKPR
jgi:hypothetical protein